MPATRSSFTLSHLAVIAYNIAVVIPPLVFGAPIGNVVLLYVAEVLALGVVSLVFIGRAERIGRASSLPYGASHPTLRLAGLFFVSFALLAFFAIGIAKISGWSFTPIAFWLPLTLLVVRQARDAVVAARSADSEDAASMGLASAIIRFIILALAVAGVIWLERDVLGGSNILSIGAIALGSLVFVKTVVELWLVHHRPSFNRRGSPPSSAAVGRRRRRTSRDGTGSS